jgi:thioredoxin-like negative regulator of GroEL
MLFRVFVLICFCLLIPQVEAASPSGHWKEGSLAQALRRSKGKRPVLLQVHAHWCTPCNQLRYEVLESSKGRALLKKAVGMFVNFETSAGRKVTRRYRILGLPTTLVLSPTGEEIGRIQGYPGRRLWLSTLNDLLEGRQGFKALEKKARQHPNNPKWQAKLAQVLLFRGQTKRAKALFATLMKRNDTWGHYALRSWGRYLLRVQRKAKAGTKHFLAAYKRFQKTRHATGYLYWAAKGYQMQNKPKKAAALFRPLLQSPRGWMLWADFQEHYKYPPKEVERSLRKALKASPGSSWLYYLLAKTMKRMGKKKEARQAIQTALRQRPTMAIYRYFAQTLK